MTSHVTVGMQVPQQQRDCEPRQWGGAIRPFNEGVMAGSSIPCGSPHVRCTPRGGVTYRTCGGPDGIRKIAHVRFVSPCLIQVRLEEGLFVTLPDLSTLQLVYAPWAVHFHPNGGQFDFVWLSARTLHGAYAPWGARVVPGRLTKSRNTHPENITALLRREQAEPFELRLHGGR